MRKLKRGAALLLALLLCCAFAVTASAHDVPDLSRTGSISVAMAYDGQPVGGGTLTLYRVGEVSQEDGNYRFSLTGAFAASGLSLADRSDADLAQALADYAAANGIAGTAAVEIGADGTGTADGLALGLYLVTQSESADGFEPAAPFLVGVPLYEDGAYVYHVDATPKLGTLTKSPAAPTPGTAGTGTTLPQTGQLNWPIPVLTVLGLALLVVGWSLRFGRQRNAYGA